MNNTANLLAHARIIIGNPPPKGMCDDCGEITNLDAAHICNADERVAAGMAAAWRYLIGGKTAKDRAKGYAVIP